MSHAVTLSLMAFWSRHNHKNKGEPMKSTIALGALAAAISFGACASPKDAGLCDDAAYAKAEKKLDESELGK